MRRLSAIGAARGRRYVVRPVAFWWAVIFFAIFLIGLTKSGFGSGVGLMIVPMTVSAMGYTHWGAPATLGLMLPLLILGDLIAVWQYRQGFDWQRVKRLMPPTALGVLVGGATLWWFHSQPPTMLTGLIKAEVGLESVGLVALHWWRTWRLGNQHIEPTTLKTNITGVAAGASSTLAHAAGPIIALYLLPTGIDRRRFVGTCAVYFFILNTAKLPAYGLASMFDKPILWLAVRCMPLVVCGAIVGVWLNRRINDRLFSQIVYALTFVLGWYLLYQGIVAIWPQVSFSRYLLCSP